MKKIGLYLVVLMMFLSGCAVMNTSMLETAETTRPGYPKFGVEYGYGLDLTTTMLIENIPSDSTNFNAKRLLSLPVYGMKAGFGLTENMDINGKIWVSFGGAGFKGYIKHRLPNDSENVFLAIMPGITYVTTESDDETEEDDFIEIAEITSYGFEIPFLATYRVGEALAFTGMIRYSADFISIVEADIDETFMLNRLGVVGGIPLELGPLYIRPEVGIEMATPKNGSFGAAPIFAIGAGLDF